MKPFYAWNEKKIKIDKNKNINHPKIREIWWCSVGVNIGSEIFGKGRNYCRPVLVINAEGSKNFIGIPISSKVKNKKYSCIIKTADEVIHTALVYQIRSFDKKRLINRKYILSSKEYLNVEKYFKSSINYDSPFRGLSALVSKRGNLSIPKLYIT